MFAPFRAFKNPVLLNEKEHKDLKIKKSLDYSFMKEVEIVPLGFSEILPATMYYPVMIGSHEGELFPFAVMGVDKKNVFINEEGFFKVDAIPKVCEMYPFSVIKQRFEGREEWAVVVDLACINEEGERLFTEEGEETSYFSEIKAKLTELAIDFQKAIEFCQEITQAGCVQSVNLKIECKYGKAVFKNVFIGNIEALRKIQPEKLYYLNTSGYLPIIYAIYFSARNFKLFDLIN